jgi:hypothetical protein
MAWISFGDREERVNESGEDVLARCAGSEAGIR